MRRVSLLPRGLYGRAALILIVPIVTIQLVVSITFIQRHFERVTEQMTAAVAQELRFLLEEVEAADSEALARQRLAQLGRALAIEARFVTAGDPAVGDRREAFDLSGRVVADTLAARVAGLGAVDLVSGDGEVITTIRSRWGDLWVSIDRRRVSATNPHQLLVLMIVTSALMTMIAYLFLSNQLRPIKRLAEAAEAFGKGHSIPYRPRGATEVRAAGRAFLDMRARIERQIEQRTQMLSGVSHDLRTPLTRLRLGLSLLPEDAETRALLADVADMERLVNEFLAFVRGDALEEAEMADPVALARRVVENAQRAGQAVTLGRIDGAGRSLMRPQAVARALENLLGNAVRHGKRAELSVTVTASTIRLTVEDDGPGIPEARREEALVAFSRLDLARDPNRGGGVGLGLTIAADIARSHGGTLRLGDSDRLGGLKAELVLAR
ncbi:MAG: hypothetical protein RIR62_635 [Pseudomonadota bacterium]|jgi:two-component system osmolarity sensor histidine kinase EnvZ